MSRTTPNAVDNLTDESAEPKEAESAAHVAEVVQEGVDILEAARLTGVSDRTIQRRIAEGMYPQAQRDMTRPGHPWRISKSIVLEMGARKRPSRQDHADMAGELAAAAFQLFEAAVDIVQVVIRLKAQPEVVFKLYDQWRKARAMTPAAAPVTTTAEPTKPVDWRNVK